MGPTASGKSALAISLAQHLGGVIINADAMQMYCDLRIITARPGEDEEALVPHRLYGVLEATDEGSVARWLELVVPEIRRCWQEGTRPILVGGTGMYIKALMEGLSVMPEVPGEVRAEARALGPDALAQHDPVMDARLKPGDTQRRLRALEVMLATGRSLAEWQEEKTESPLPEAVFEVYRVERPREEIYDRINRRFETMVEEGVLEEVSALKELFYAPARGCSPAQWAAPPQQVRGRGSGLGRPAGLPSLIQEKQNESADSTSAQSHQPAKRSAIGAPAGARGAQLNNLPILKAHGVPELIAYLDGEMTLEEAIAKAQQNTRNYAKRQMTWLRNQLPDAVAVASADDILDRLP